jgi:hypothetical protein
VGTSPEPDLLEAFTEKAGEDKPKLGEMKVCWHEDESAARRTIHRLWPNMGLPGELSQELATPAHCEQASSIVTEEMVADTPPCGPDPEPYLESIQQCVEAGYDEIYMHRVGPDQEGFFRFYERGILPEPRPKNGQSTAGYHRSGATRPENGSPIPPIAGTSFELTPSRRPEAGSGGVRTSRRPAAPPPPVPRAPRRGGSLRV